MAYGYIKAKADGLSLAEHTNAVLNTALYLTEYFDNISKDTIRWISIFHDLGKANPLFQSNMDRNNFDDICRHEISSILFIDSVPEEIRDLVAKVILSHHKSFNVKENRSLNDIFENKDDDILFKNHIGDIDVWGKDVKDFLFYNYNINIEIPIKERCEEILNEYVDKFNKDYRGCILENGCNEYRGLFMMADHFGSAYPNEHDRYEMFKKMFTTPDTSIYNTKDKKYPLSLYDIDFSKKHTFVTAPCGAGKTNIMMKACKNRIFYCLPFQASINAMFQRLRNDLGDEYEYAIKHSSFKSLKFISDHVKSISGFFGSSVKVMTPFQMMKISIYGKGYESILMDLKGQDIIFDEIHTYQEPRTIKAVLNLIRVLVKNDCHIHICSATMPTTLKNIILDILGEEDTQVINLSKEELSSFNRHILYTKDDFDYEDIKKRYEKGEKVLVVRNQVKLSQQTYLMLQMMIPNVKILLLHSKYKREDRNNIERMLMEYNSKNEPCIVVSTQVVEVSLDINFDCLYTDVADIMSLIQRFGRINRQRKDTTIRRDVIVVNYSKKEYAPYKKDVTDKTFEILCKYNGCELDENYVQSLIDYVHNDTYTLDDKFMYPYDKHGEWKETECFDDVDNHICDLLQFDGDILILEKDVDSYIKTNDDKYEIPFCFYDDGTKTKKIKELSLREYCGGKSYVQFYIVPNSMYNNELGLIQK